VALAYLILIPITSYAKHLQHNHVGPPITQFQQHWCPKLNTKSLVTVFYLLFGSILHFNYFTFFKPISKKAIGCPKLQNYAKCKNKSCFNLYFTPFKHLYCIGYILLPTSRSASRTLHFYVCIKCQWNFCCFGCVSTQCKSFYRELFFRIVS